MNTTEIPAHKRTLSRLFVVVAVLETFYAALGLLTPPSLVAGLTGWNLSPDGQWILKLLGAALASQALVAWTQRRDPHRGVAAALALYQFVSATVDVFAWARIEGAFSTPLARFWLMAAIPSHYLVGLLLVGALLRAPRDAEAASQVA